MEFDKEFMPIPYEIKALNHVNKVSSDDKISFGFVYTECEELHRYSGYCEGYKQAIKDASKVLHEHGIDDVNLQNILIYNLKS